MNMNETQIRLVAGLGNPDPEYLATRHNAGFMLVDRFLEKAPKSFEKIFAHQSWIWRGTYAGKALLLQKPMTYMNLSGNAVASLARSEGIRPEEILVVHDDMDLPMGRIRIRRGGGSAGHNGIKSIIERLGGEDFHRMRIGIGRAEARSGVVDYVLSPFEGDEAEVLNRTLAGAADALILALRRGVAMAMNRFNSMDWSRAAEENGQPVAKA